MEYTRRRNLNRGYMNEEFDKLHYEVENKLLALIESLETKRGTGEWSDSLPHHPTPASTP